MSYKCGRNQFWKSRIRKQMSVCKLQFRSVQLIVSSRSWALVHLHQLRDTKWIIFKIRNLEVSRVLQVLKRNSCFSETLVRKVGWGQGPATHYEPNRNLQADHYFREHPDAPSRSSFEVFFTNGSDPSPAKFIVFHHGTVRFRVSWTVTIQPPKWSVNQAQKWTPPRCSCLDQFIIQFMFCIRLCLAHRKKRMNEIFIYM